MESRRTSSRASSRNITIMNRQFKRKWIPLNLLLLSWQLLSISLVLLSILTPTTDSTRIATNKMYQSIQDNYFCFRRLNATHEIGCQSHPSLGNVGVLHLVQSLADIDYIVNRSTVSPFVVMLPLKYFTTNNLRILRASNKVNGVLVIRNETSNVPDKFSPDQSCPNDNYGLYREGSEFAEYSHCKKQKWVPDASQGNSALDMMFESWPFPIFLITKSDSLNKLMDCFNRFNRPEEDGIERSWPLCSAQLSMKMHAAVSSVKCLSRNEHWFALESSHFCDPLVSKNVFSNLFLPDQKEERQPVKDKSIILLTARLDSFSMFDELSPGASSVTGLVTLMAVAQTLSSLREKIKMNQKDKDVNMIFAIFDGEAFDYIGSSATAVDMRDRKFPQVLNSNIVPQSISLDSLKAVIELNQLAKFTPQTSTKGLLYIHGDPVSRRKPEVEQSWKDVYANFESSRDVEVKQPSNLLQGLPPSSVQSFLRQKNDIIGLHLANHDREFTSSYYNSFLDDDEQYSKDEFTEKFTNHLASVATVVSKAMYKLVTGGSSVPSEVKAEASRELVRFTL